MAVLTVVLLAIGVVEHQQLYESSNHQAVTVIQLLKDTGFIAASNLFPLVLPSPWLI